MKARYDSSQDITLILSEEERDVLFLAPTSNFFDIHVSSERTDLTNRHYLLLTTMCEELASKIFLGYTLNEEDLFRNALKIENGFGKINIPEEAGIPWIINLSREGIEFARKGWSHGARYNGNSKLFIFKKNPQEVLNVLRYYNRKK